MRLWTRVLTAATACAAMLTATGVAAPAERVYPRVRSEGGFEAGTRRPPPIAPLDEQVPTPASPPRAPDRTPLRAPDGELRGRSDQPSARPGSRATARDSEGTAFGTVAPNRLGGGTVRGSDGSREGMVPSSPRRQRFEP